MSHSFPTRRSSDLLRLLAVSALTNLAFETSNVIASEALSGVAVSDKFALVREAALRGQLSVDRTRGTRLAAEVAARDPEPKVRELAARIQQEARPRAVVPTAPSN